MRILDLRAYENPRLPFSRHAGFRRRRGRTEKSDRLHGDHRISAQLDSVRGKSAAENRRGIESVRDCGNVAATDNSAGEEAGSAEETGAQSGRGRKGEGKIRRGSEKVCGRPEEIRRGHREMDGGR